MSKNIISALVFFNLVIAKTARAFECWALLADTPDGCRKILGDGVFSAFVDFTANFKTDMSKFYQYLAVYNTIRNRPLLRELLDERGITMNELKIRMANIYSIKMMEERINKIGTKDDADMARIEAFIEEPEYHPSLSAFLL